MREESSLAELSPGGYGLVAGLAVGGAMGCRLRDLGFLPGASVEALGKSPLGDPIAYLVRGTVIAPVSYTHLVALVLLLCLKRKMFISVGSPRYDLSLIHIWTRPRTPPGSR